MKNPKALIEPEKIVIQRFLDGIDLILKAANNRMDDNEREQNWVRLEYLTEQVDNLRGLIKFTK